MLLVSECFVTQHWYSSKICQPVFQIFCIPNILFTLSVEKSFSKARMTEDQVLEEPVEIMEPVRQKRGKNYTAPKCNSDNSMVRPKNTRKFALVQDLEVENCAGDNNNESNDTDLVPGPVTRVTTREPVRKSGNFFINRSFFHVFRKIS